MRTEEPYKKIWHDILRKSKEFPKDIAERFLIADNIDPLKFKENHDYYVMDRYGDNKPTSSCFYPWLDLPLSYPYWFASAYPDVVKYFAYLPDDVLDEELTRLYEGMGFTKKEWEGYDNPKLWKLDEQGVHFFSVEVLYKLKERYKELHPNAKLECQ